MKKDKTNKTSLPLFGIPRVLPFMKPYRARIIFMILLGGITTVIDTLYPLFNRYALDRFVGEKTLEGIGMFAAAYILLLLVQTVINFKSTYDCGWIEMNVDRDLRNAAFNHLQTLSFSYYNQNAVGYIHARVMSDTGLIGEMVSWQMMHFVWDGAYLISMLVIMYRVDTRLALYIFALIPVAVFMMVFFQRKLVVFNRKIREINAKITGNFNEGIIGARTIKLLHVEDQMNSDFWADTAAMRAESVREAHYSALFVSTVSMMSAFVLSLVLWQGGQLTKEGLMRIGTLSVFMSYALQMLEPIQNIIETISRLAAVQVNIERFTRLLSETSDVADTPEVIEKYGDTFSPKKDNWEELRGDVEFRDVSFMYPDGDEYVLSHFNLKVPHGTNVAIVGETGAGKSTLVNLVCRFYEPTEGQILIDGRDAKERSQLWLHSNIGYVLQTPHLFAGTVRDNLRYGKPDATDKQIWEALRLVSADGVVRGMDQGLDSNVGEGGEMLSTGEKQLLSFARAILADPKILVLDEATSSIDTVTEKAIQKAIEVVIRGRTSFVIAHRLSTIVDADVILVVRDGKIIGQGTHEELMRQKGYYYQLYTHQYAELLWQN
ncbi:MAG: ABC transporter ATP-binding protein/permease [Lachnospiraceae bacterium]|nr:ABC transporter ATP-binding protein/permease [Lachnospiraceae bacterium]